MNIKRAGFTPGPWELVTDSHNRIFVRHELSNTEREPGYFVEIRNYSRNGKFDANAQLVVAAPELYEACLAALEWRGLDGDGISEPTRSMLISVLKRVAGN